MIYTFFGISLPISSCVFLFIFVSHLHGVWTSKRVLPSLTHHPLQSPKCLI